MKYGNIEFIHRAQRGYGRCDRLYNWKTAKAIDFGYVANEYQDSVGPIDGDYKRICELLDKQPISMIEELVEQYGDTSPCGLYTNPWDYDMLTGALNRLGASV